MAESPADIDGTELEVLRAGIRLMALRALGGADVADEVAQETVVRAFHSLRSSQQRPEKLGAFVAGIARHVIADVIRARKHVPLDQLAPSAEPRTGRDALVAMCDASERARVHDALKALAPDDRELLQLVFFEGLSPTKIAERLGVPPERIRQRKLRAIARLRLAFGEPADSADSSHGNPSSTTMKSGASNALEPTRSSE